MKNSEEVNMKELEKAIMEINKEDDIAPEQVVEYLITALKAAYKEHYETEVEPDVIINDKGTLEINVVKTIVENPSKEEEISLEDAQKLKRTKKEKEALKIGDQISVKISPKSFGRIAAQKAKQIILQKMREKEKELRYEEYTEKTGEIVTGLVQKVGNLVIVDIGNLEAAMPKLEQVKTEEYKVNQKLRVYIKNARQVEKGNVQVLVSRSDKNFVKRLFEYEIPELDEGLVEIKSIAREAGERTKIAVYSSNPNIDPVGTLVGQKGMRIQNIINELNGERIDVIEWSEDPMQFIASALLPAEVLAIDIHEDEKFAQVIVEDKELSVAIGKAGQNVKLAATLTGYKIDIKTEEQFRKILENKALGIEEEDTNNKKIDLNEKVEKEEEKTLNAYQGDLGAKTVSKEEYIDQDESEE